MVPVIINLIVVAMCASDNYILARNKGREKNLQVRVHHLGTMNICMYHDGFI